MALDVQAARAEALFASQVQPSHDPTRYQVHATITNIIVEYGSRWCAAQVATEFGDHPDTAAARMSWARALVAMTYPPRHLHRKRRGLAKTVGEGAQRRYAMTPAGAELAQEITNTR